MSINERTCITTLDFSREDGHIVLSIGGYPIGLCKKVSLSQEADTLPFYILTIERVILPGTLEIVGTCPPSLSAAAQENLQVRENYND